MKRMYSTRQAFGDALVEIGHDRRILVLDSDVSKSTKTFGFAEKYPERFFNIGIAENNMVGVAAGMATTGNNIVFACSFAVFVVMRSFEQIRNSICYPKLNVKLVGTHSGVQSGKDGTTHHAVEDIAIMRSIPNMTVISPADAVETVQALKAAAYYEGPVYIRLGRIDEPILFDQSKYEFTLGKGSILQKGSDLTLIATGSMVNKTLNSAKLLREKKISARVVNIHTIKPIDKKILIDSAKSTGAIVVCEEHSVLGGLGSAVAEVLSQEYPVPLGFVGIKDKFGKSGSLQDLINFFELTEEDICKTALSTIEKKHKTKRISQETI